MFIPDPCKDSQVHTKINQITIPVGDISLRKYVSKTTLRCGMKIGKYIFEVIGPVETYLIPVKSNIEAIYDLVRYTDHCWDIEPVYKLLDLNTFDYDLKINRSCFISSTKDNNDLHDIKVYPNPASSFVTLESKTINIKQVSILDISGKLLYSIHGKGEKKLKLALDHFSPGIYILKVGDQKIKIETIKLVIR